MTTNIYFVWVQGFREPTPQIFYGLDQNKDSHGKDKLNILQHCELPTEHKDLNLNQLAMIYPYKVNK